MQDYTTDYTSDNTTHFMGDMDSFTHAYEDGSADYGDYFDMGSGDSDGSDDYHSMPDNDQDYDDTPSSCSGPDCHEGCAAAMANWREEMSKWKYMRNGEMSGSIVFQILTGSIL